MKRINKIKENAKCHKYVAIPLAAVISIVPLITYLKVEDIKSFNNEVLNNFWISNIAADLFTYYKMITLLIFTLIALTIYLYYIYSKGLRVEKLNYYIPMGIYAALVILSTIISKNKSISVYGIFGRHEGVLALLAYMVIMFLAVNNVKDKKQINMLLTSLFISSSVISIIGILQYFKIDIITNGFISKIIAPGPGKVNLSSHEGTVYGTLAHYNYMGSYMSLVFPISLVLFLFVKNKKHKIFMGVVSALTGATLIISNSRAGLVGAFIALVVLAIVCRKYIFKKWIYAVSLILALFLAFTAINMISRGSIAKRIGTLFADASHFFQTKDYKGLKSVITKDNIIEIAFSNEKLIINCHKGKLIFKDKEGSVIHECNGEEIVKFNDETFREFEIHVKKVQGVYVLNVIKEEPGKTNKLAMDFLINNEESKYVDFAGRLADLKPIEKWGFSGKEALGSARGYIWSRSLPLLKKTVILGYGPDNYSIYFPQHDYIGKLINYGTPGMFVDKPHNLYLNVAINTGLLSLAALIVIFAIYLVSSFKIYYRADLSSMYSYAGLAIFAGVCGYLGSGMFNDSVVTVAPVFWVLLGMGISINRMVNSASK